MSLRLNPSKKINLILFLIVDRSYLIAVITSLILTGCGSNSGLQNQFIDPLELQHDNEIFASASIAIQQQLNLAAPKQADTLWTTANYDSLIQQLPLIPDHNLQIANSEDDFRSISSWYSIGGRESLYQKAPPMFGYGYGYSIAAAGDTITPYSASLNGLLYHLGEFLDRTFEDEDGNEQQVFANNYRAGNILINQFGSDKTTTIQLNLQHNPQLNDNTFADLLKCDCATTFESGQQDSGLSIVPSDNYPLSQYQLTFTPFEYGFGIFARLVDNSGRTDFLAAVVGQLTLPTQLAELQGGYKYSNYNNTLSIIRPGWLQSHPANYIEMQKYSLSIEVDFTQSIISTANAIVSRKEEDDYKYYTLVLDNSRPGQQPDQTVPGAPFNIWLTTGSNKLLAANVNEDDEFNKVEIDTANNELQGSAGRLFGAFYGPRGDYLAGVMTLQFPQEFAAEGEPGMWMSAFYLGKND